MYKDYKKADTQSNVGGLFFVAAFLLGIGVIGGSTIKKEPLISEQSVKNQNLQRGFVGQQPKTSTSRPVAESEDNNFSDKEFELEYISLSKVENEEDFERIYKELEARKGGWMPTRKQLKAKFAKNKKFHEKYREQTKGNWRQPPGSSPYAAQLAMDVKHSNTVKGAIAMKLEVEEAGVKKKDECAYLAKKMTKEDFENKQAESKQLEQKKGLLFFEDATYDYSTAESLPTRFVNRDEMRKKFEKSANKNTKK